MNNNMNNMNNMNLGQLMNMIAHMDKKELQSKMNEAQAIINANGGAQAMMKKLSNNNNNSNK